jgi:hypothetical protein
VLSRTLYGFLIALNAIAVIAVIIWLLDVFGFLEVISGVKI